MMNASDDHDDKSTVLDPSSDHLKVCRFMSFILHIYAILAILGGQFRLGSGFNLLDVSVNFYISV